MRSLALILAAAMLLAAGGPVTAADAPPPFTGIVYAHNKERRLIGVPPLVWSDELADLAQRWAEEVADNGCAVKYRNVGAVGQNILVSDMLLTSPPRLAVTDWLKERQWFDSRTGRCSNGHDCGNYTQVVWRTSQRLGCGYAQCGRTSAVLVCDYDPVGNIVGRRPY